MGQKVSVIVPIYKVEKYLSRCVDTIRNQTHRNLEIILVNDGSPDNCGTIADEFANHDERIKVVHKENGGLSDARNLGMQKATGEFIVFVDSDDWLESTMIEKMIEASVKFKADIVQSAFYYAYDEYLLFDKRFSDKESSPLILDNKKIMSELVINEKVKNFAWGKLYKAEMVKDIPFQKGVLFEDVFWAHKVMHRVNTYVILNHPLYFYYQRNDSIVSTYSIKNLDIIKGLKERQLFIEEYYEELSHESYKVLLKNMLIHYNLLLINRNKDKGGLYKKDLKIYVKNNYQKFKNSVKNDNTLKRQLFWFSIHPYLNVLYLVFIKVLRDLKIGPKSIGLEKIILQSNRG
ncbi:glycosyltransferase [Neobacillus sp. PS3-34]|uniref:glycosyltransferase family 2 protein n=1 Tax=Neobacillus sp. PS3-34 TaxID=3070678 RepID=UPI0027DEC036|nr:glycosyltransferase [Neobacillus sp. PS3-34]WML47807.1 glycosyltransferase [Neobacillus sp. PS3-34]